MKEISVSEVKIGDLICTNTDEDGNPIFDEFGIVKSIQRQFHKSYFEHSNVIIFCIRYIHTHNETMAFKYGSGETVFKFNEY